jgi:sulfonate transport system substrate-binding protein
VAAAKRPAAASADPVSVRCTAMTSTTIRRNMAIHAEANGEPEATRFGNSCHKESLRCPQDPDRRRFHQVLHFGQRDCNFGIFIMYSVFQRILWWLATSVLFIAMAAIPVSSAAADREQLRIGYQKYWTLIVLKARGTLEQRLKPLGVDVTWTEFTAGPPMLDGLNNGSVDFVTVGDAPPIFAQAAGTKFVYVGNEPPAPTGEAILVPKHSSIESVGDLKGKKIALNKGSNVQYLLVQALEHAGVKYAEVQPVFLPPKEARAAFERGDVDAWVIWDPFLIAAETQIDARKLADGAGIVSNYQFYLAATGYAERRPDVVKIVLQEIGKIDDWGKKNPNEMAAFLAPSFGLDVPTVERMAAGYGYGVAPITPEVIAEQQKVADTFAELKLIATKPDISAVAWTAH